jgi:DNA repair ATPase RecN
MNQPMEERFKKIEDRLDDLERKERRFDFDIRDIAHKTTMALGILTAQEADIKEMKGDIRDMKTALAEQNTKLDQILDRLPPKQ